MTHAPCKEVWRFDTGCGVMAPPISYAVNGKQYIAVAAGPHWLGAEAGGAQARQSVLDGLRVLVVGCGWLERLVWFDVALLGDPRISLPRPGGERVR